MPLKATLDGRHILSFKLPEDLTWDELREASRAGRVTMSCCGVPAIPKTMHGHGTRFFAHKVRLDCAWAGESEEHERLKAAAAMAAMAVGWSAETEVSGPDWRADVLAEKWGMRVAIEIQMSPQTLPETHRRTERYLNAGVKVIWLFKKIPDGLQLGPTMPAFEVENEDQVRDLVNRFLTSGLVWNDAVNQPVPATLVGYDVMCEDCGIIWHTTPYYVRQAFESDNLPGKTYFIGSVPDLFAGKAPDFLFGTSKSLSERRFGARLQFCPRCGRKPPDKCLDLKAVTAWPHRQVDFMDHVYLQEGWDFPRKTPKQFDPNTTLRIWNRILDDQDLTIDPEDITIWGPAKRKAWRKAKEEEIRELESTTMRERYRIMVDEMKRQLEKTKAAMLTKIEETVSSKTARFVVDDIVHVYGHVTAIHVGDYGNTMSFLLKFPYNDAISSHLRDNFNGRWQPEERGWLVRCSPSSARELLTFLEDAGSNPDAYWQADRVAS